MIGMWVPSTAPRTIVNPIFCSQLAIILSREVTSSGKCMYLFDRLSLIAWHTCRTREVTVHTETPKVFAVMLTVSVSFK